MRADVKAEEILELLKKVEDPETGSSIVDLGLVSGVEVQSNGITVYVNFNKAMPSCKACAPIAWMVVGAIIRRMERVLRGTGMKYRIVESSTNLIHGEG